MRVLQGIAGRALVAAIVMTAVSSAAQAAPVVFAGLDNHDLSNGGAHPNSDAALAAFATAASAEGGLAVQNFDGLALGAAPAGFAIGSINATLTATATSYTNIASGVGGFTTYPVSGKRFLDSLSDRNTTYFSVSFDHAVSGIGFHITDASDWSGDPRPTTNLVITLKYQNANVDLKIFDGTSASTMVNGSFGFWGVVDTASPLLGFSITNPAGNPGADAIGLDNLSVALVKTPTTVPVPASLPLLLSAVGGMTGLARRRQVSVS